MRIKYFQPWNLKGECCTSATNNLDFGSIIDKQDFLPEEMSLDFAGCKIDLATCKLGFHETSGKMLMPTFEDFV